MTMTGQDHPQRERTQQQDQAYAANQAHAAEQRQAAAHVGTAVADVRSERARARHLGADMRRLEDAGRILDEQINGRDDMIVLRPGNALRHEPGSPEQGTGNLAAVAEFVHRVFTLGELPYEVLEDMHAARGDRRVAPAEQHIQESYERAYRIERAATVPAALPSGQPALTGAAPLPKRVRGTNGPYPPLEPERLVPPAPPESPAEQTGAIISALRESGHNIPIALERAARKDGGTSLDVDVPDPGFAASAIPQQRHPIGDTQPMRLDEVLGHPALDDAGAVADGDREPRPFSGTGRSGDASPGSGVGDDDES